MMRLNKYSYTYYPASRPMQTGVNNGFGVLLSGSGGFNSKMDIHFVKFALRALLNVKCTKSRELLEIINKIVKRQLAYVTSVCDVKSISLDTIINDPYFYLVYYSYTIADYQYVHLQLKRSLNMAIQKNIDLINERCYNDQRFSIRNHVGLQMNAQIKMEYLKYIKYYGIPSDGLFLPSILERIKYGLINEENYKFFDPNEDNLSEHLSDNESCSNITTPCTNTPSNMTPVISTPIKSPCSSVSSPVVNNPPYVDYKPYTSTSSSSSSTTDGITTSIHNYSITGSDINNTVQTTIVGTNNDDDDCCTPETIVSSTSSSTSTTINGITTTTITTTAILDDGNTVTEVEKIILS